MIQRLFGSDRTEKENKDVTGGAQRREKFDKISRGVRVRSRSSVLDFPPRLSGIRARFWIISSVSLRRAKL